MKEEFSFQVFKCCSDSNIWQREATYTVVRLIFEKFDILLESGFYGSFQQEYDN